MRSLPGGGIYSDYAASVRLTNCLFNGNSAQGDGGGTYNDGVHDGMPLRNCTFIDNSAARGGGMYNLDCSLDIRNSMLWGNMILGRGVETQEAQIAGETQFLRYCRVEGWTGSWGGEFNRGDEPLFADARGRLSTGSPYIDAGENLTFPIEILTDLDGNPRFVDDPLTQDTGSGDPPVIDRGAYEFQARECDYNDDSDCDEVPNDRDNCPEVPNADQSDFDDDAAGDACDPDIDDDGVLNAPDVCDFTPFGASVQPDGSLQSDADGDCDVDLYDYYLTQQEFTGAGS